MFPFLSLPLEIRLMIYQDYLQLTGFLATKRLAFRYQDIHIQHHPLPHHLFRHDLLHVCKAIRVEYLHELLNARYECVELCFCPPHQEERLYRAGCLLHQMGSSTVTELPCEQIWEQTSADAKVVRVVVDLSLAACDGRESYCKCDVVTRKYRENSGETERLVHYTGRDAAEVDAIRHALEVLRRKCASPQNVLLLVMGFRERTGTLGKRGTDWLLQEVKAEATHHFIHNLKATDLVIQFGEMGSEDVDDVGFWFRKVGDGRYFGEAERVEGIFAEIAGAVASGRV